MRVEGVPARRLPDYFSQFYLLQADGTDGPLSAEFVGLEERHMRGEVLYVVVAGLSSPDTSLASSASLPVDEDRDSYCDDDSDEGNDSDQYVVVEEDADDDLLGHADDDRSVS